MESSEEETTKEEETTELTFSNPITLTEPTQVSDLGQSEEPGDYFTFPSPVNTLEDDVNKISEETTSKNPMGASDVNAYVIATNSKMESSGEETTKEEETTGLTFSNPITLTEPTQVSDLGQSEEPDYYFTFPSPVNTLEDDVNKLSEEFTGLTFSDPIPLREPTQVSDLGQSEEPDYCFTFPSPVNTLKDDVNKISEEFTGLTFSDPITMREPTQVSDLGQSEEADYYFTFPSPVDTLEKDVHQISEETSSKHPMASDGNAYPTVPCIFTHCTRMFCSHIAMLEHIPGHPSREVAIAEGVKNFFKNPKSRHKRFAKPLKRKKRVRFDISTVIPTKKKKRDVNPTLPIDVSDMQAHLVCTECWKAFGTAGLVSRHQLVHMAEKPFQCSFDLCGRRFSERSALQEHAQVHSLQYPYVCPYVGCKRKFVSRAALAEHLILHVVT